VASAANVSQHQHHSIGIARGGGNDIKRAARHGGIAHGMAAAGINGGKRSSVVASACWRISCERHQRQHHDVAAWHQ